MKRLYETSGTQIPTLNALKKAKYAASFMNDRSWVVIDGRVFEKIDKDKWQHMMQQSSAMGGIYSSDYILNLIKKAKEFKCTLLGVKMDEAKINESVRSLNPIKTLKESLSNKPRHLADVKINEATYTKLSVTHMVEPEIAKFAKFANNKVTSYSSELKFDLDGRKFQVFGIPELENQTFSVRGDAEINHYYKPSLTFWAQNEKWYVKLDLDYMPNLAKLANGEKVNVLVVSRKNTGSDELATIQFI